MRRSASREDQDQFRRHKNQERMEHASPNFCVTDLEIRSVHRRFRSDKHVRDSRQQLLLLFGDLGGMGAELLGQFG